MVRSTSINNFQKINTFTTLQKNLKNIDSFLFIWSQVASIGGVVHSVQAPHCRRCQWHLHKGEQRCKGSWVNFDQVPEAIYSIEAQCELRNGSMGPVIGQHFFKPTDQAISTGLQYVNHTDYTFPQNMEIIICMTMPFYLKYMYSFSSVVL